MSISINSIDAIREARAVGMLSAVEARVLLALRRVGVPSTTVELIRWVRDNDCLAAGYSDSTLQARVSELAKRGIVVAEENRPCRHTGRTAAAYVVADEMAVLNEFKPKASRRQLVKMLRRAESAIACRGSKAGGCLRCEIHNTLKREEDADEI